MEIAWAFSLANGLIRCESVNVEVPVIKTNPIVIRERFMEEVRR